MIGSTVSPAIGASSDLERAPRLVNWNPVGAGGRPIPDELVAPLRWRKARHALVSLTSDLFDETVPDDYIARIWATMASARQNTFYVSTTQHRRMRILLNSRSFWEDVCSHFVGLLHLGPGRSQVLPTPEAGFPLPHVGVGVRVRDQHDAEVAVPDLLATNVALRYVDARLCGPLDLDLPRCEDHNRDHAYFDASTATQRCGLCVDDGWLGELSFGHWLDPLNDGIGWVVLHGESGRDATPLHPNWVRSLRDQCIEQDAPFWFGSWGDYICVPVEDDPVFSGGRAYDDPRGGRCAPIVRVPAPGRKSMRGSTARLLQPGESTRTTVLLDRDTIAVRVGSVNAGRALDGRTWDQFPSASV
ncbi:phage Gp37Gp68 family protein [Mycobacteroides abscessus subsp. bolletii]|uniref:DUF5131 family protein n=1 Tax=Mycobacteroides abscessus TaxID=36809 RepID=UPI0009C8B4CF|nr:DUF5131 family protein [Mycobacteroides abscessus]SKZ03446.1 phage Gp37Gp68 family protein [Mycobacteroides abscessus subsp. bolletii]